MITKFFEQLAGYYNKENDLSNIVVALCNINHTFREKFTRFFFPNIDTENIKSILREVPDKDNRSSRVDIYISMHNDKTPYIIEVKINDQNHHFGQYEEAYKINKERFGYITNYKCIEGMELGYDVKTWEELYDYLNESENSDELINAFKLYLKYVCGIIKYIKPMNITNLTAIPCFVNTAKKIISKERNWVKTTFYREYAYSSSIHEGFYIKFPDNDDVDGFALYGLWFQEKPIISICINSRPWLCDKIMNNQENTLENISISKQPYKEQFWNKDDVWFEMNDENFKKLICAQSYNEQQTILEEFFDEVISYIQKYF